MSTSRGSAAANAGGLQTIPAGARKVVQSLKEIVSCSEMEIYATLKDCNMDPNEAVNRLLSQDPFREVKSKREKKKEGKDHSEPRSRVANNSSNRGSKVGADRHFGRGASGPYGASETPFHGKPTYKKENGLTTHTSSLSSATGVPGNSRSWGSPGLSDGASAESKGSLLGTPDSMPSLVQPVTGYQSSWGGVPGQMSMADIVRMGRPHSKTSTVPNASHHQSEGSLVQQVHEEWPSIEKPAATNVTSAPEYTVDNELHPEETDDFDDINEHTEVEETQEREDDDSGSTRANDEGSVSMSSRKNPEEDIRGASLFENDMYKGMGSYPSETHDFEHREDDEVGVSVSSVTRNLQQLNVQKDENKYPSDGNAPPSVVIPDHLQVQTADCSHLSFGSFGSMASAPVKPNLEEAPSEVDVSSVGHSGNRHPEYYVDDSLRNAPEASLYHTGASGGNYESSSASQPEELKPESPEVSHENQYSFPSSAPGYTFEDAQRLAATFNQTNTQTQNLGQFSNVMHSYSNSLPSTLLASSVHPSRESELQYSQFPVTQAKYGNSVSSIGGSAISMSEALKTAGLPSSQPAPQTISGTSVATGPPLPQHLVHPYSQPTLSPLGPFANMISYPFLPQSYTYMPSAFQQSFAGNSTYHQSLAAAVLPQYKSSVSVSSLPQSAAVPSGYGAAFGNTATIPGNYQMTPPAAPSGTTLSYDDVLSSHYKDNSHLLSLQHQQNENSAMWLHGANSRTMPAVPGSNYYNYQGQQNQQPSGFRQQQGQQQHQSQNYGAPGYQNLYHSQTGISLEQQQQNPREVSLGGAQGQPKQSQIWPNSY